MLQFLATTFGIEAVGYAYRYGKRATMYRKALARARELGRPLYILGAPDRGPTGKGVPAPYGCGEPDKGDVVLDYGESDCPNAVQWDLRQGLPWLSDASVVVFESCVLEYIEGDPNRVAAELQRVSGGEMFAVRVEWWCPITHVTTGSHHLVRSAVTANTAALNPPPAESATMSLDDLELDSQFWGFGQGF